jgi:hypothetical protein
VAPIRGARTGEFVQIGCSVAANATILRQAIVRFWFGSVGRDGDFIAKLRPLQE